jgi:WD40 repeat protein
VAEPSRTPLLKITGHKGPVSSVAYSRDGKFVASGGSDMDVKLWGAESGLEVRSFRGHTNWVTSVAFSSDSHFLASASVDQKIMLWEIAGTEVARTYGHNGALNTVAASPNGKWLASGGLDHTIILWDPATGAEVHTLAGHEGQVNALAFSPDSKLLASAGSDLKIKLWDPATGQETRAIPVAGVTGLFALTFTAEGKQVAVWASTATSTQVHFYDPSTGARPKMVNVPNRHPCLAFAGDGTLAALGTGKGGDVLVWDLDKGQQLGATFRAHLDGVSDLIFTPDKKFLITGSETGEVKIWDLAKRETPVRTIKAHPKRINAFAIQPDGSRFATTGDGVVQLWETASGKELRRWDFGSPIRNMAFTPDGKQVATANPNTVLYLLQLP